MVLGVVAGLKNGELVMAGVVGGDCRDKMADRLPRSYRWVWRFWTVFGSGQEAKSLTCWEMAQRSQNHSLSYDMLSSRAHDRFTSLVHQFLALTHSFLSSKLPIYVNWSYRMRKNRLSANRPFWHASMQLSNSTRYNDCYLVTLITSKNRKTNEHSRSWPELRI